MCAATAFGMKRDIPFIYENVAIPVYTCSLIKECIAPDQSSRNNHRQDQAALRCNLTLIIWL
jgi:hypothetical protein